jgi:hypothetical protein
MHRASTHRPFLRTTQVTFACVAVLLGALESLDYRFMVISASPPGVIKMSLVTLFSSGSDGVASQHSMFGIYTFMHAVNSHEST